MTTDRELEDQFPPVVQARIGLFGGSFDPIHLGHLIVATEALRQLKLDRLLFLPASQPPHKPDQRLSSADHRCRMIELAIAGRQAFELSMLDLSPTGPSYSADLVQKVHRAYPASELFFIIGGDSLRDFHTWHEPNRIAKFATVGVAGRPDGAYDLGAVLEQTPALIGRVVEVKAPFIDISSTDIRQRVRNREVYWYQVPLEVERYIDETGLYRSAE